MPRNSAFKKATKAFARTREFFSYESPYPTVVPAGETCHGPCCARICTAASASSASAEAEAEAEASAPAPGNKPVVVEPPETPLREEKGDSESDESESSDEDDEHAIPDENDTANDSCDCKTCLAARFAGVNHKCDPKDVAAYAAAKKAKDELYRAAAEKFPGWAQEKRQRAQGLKNVEQPELEHGGVSLEELKGQVLAEKDLRDVLRWACEKVIKVTVPLGDRALLHMIATLSTSAKAGMKQRQGEGAAEKVEAMQTEAVERATVVNRAMTEATMPLGKQASRQMVGTRTTITEASVEEKLNVEMMKGLRRQAQAFAEQSSHPVGIGAEQGHKILNTITRAPMTDEQYEEISTRSLYFNGVLPSFSKSDIFQLLCRYGEVEKYRVMLHSRNHETCWLGFFTMASPEAADAAKKDLHGKVVEGHALMVEKPPHARFMKDIQAQIKKAKAAKPLPDSKKDEEQTDRKSEARLSYADKAYLAERLQQLNHKERDEVAEMIATDVPAVKRISGCKVAVDLDDLSNVVLLKLLAYFWKRFGCPSGESRSRMVSPPAVVQAQSKNMCEIPAVQSGIGKSSKPDDTSESVIQDGDNKKRQRAVTKWDLLRGLKCAAKEFLQLGTVMADEEFGRFVDTSVMSAPNLPTGVYTILRNDILAQSIGRLMDQLRAADSKDGLGQSKSIREADRDLVARRWKTLKLDFPEVAAMISKLHPERDQMRAWIKNGRHLSSSCLYIVAADEKFENAIAQALGDKDLHGPDDLAAFTRRLAEIDKDARFQLDKPEPADVDLREARCKELLELGIKIIGRYPGLNRLISLETELPYHPNREEGQFEDASTKQC
jgi:hypothetical protein